MKRNFLLISVILSGFAILPAFGKEDKDEKSKEKNEAKFYGYIQKMPKERTGIWQDKDKKIKVDKKTEIDEKYGKAKVGSYVKVEGFIDDKEFFVTEIEVKKAKDEENENKKEDE